MNPSIDDTLARLAHATHSPRGRHAATDQTYQSLLDRIPAGQRPVIGRNERQPRAAFKRWSAAACLLLVVGIALAIAGIWQHYHLPSTVESQPVSAPSDIQVEPRTLVYQATPLADIIAELSDVFDTPIQIVTPELCSYSVTATFRTDESLDEILAVLAEIGNFEVRKSAEGVALFINEN